MTDWAQPGGGLPPPPQDQTAALRPPPPSPPVPMPQPMPQPGPWQYGPQWQGMQPWRRNGGLVLAIRILVSITAVLGLVIGGLSWNVQAAAEDYVDHISWTTRSDLNDAYGLYALGFFVWLLAYVATAILFVIWMYRIASNNDVLGRPGRTFGPGWAIGGWFIPLANYVIPILHLQQLWKGSDRAAPRGHPGWRAVAQSPLMWIWWLCFVGPGIVNGFGRFVVNRTDIDTDPEEALDALTTQLTLETLAQAGLAVAAVLCCVVVGQLTQRQDEAGRAHGIVQGSGYWG